ncbi:MAG: ABC transporter ATP-binding protein [Euryarchaeota archaeon]|nr:ABC transporter ATP-binding protein [Euryarchaeota archaeon]
MKGFTVVDRGSADRSKGSAPALEARAVWRTYFVGTDSEFHALSDVSLSIAQGEYVALMGPSGSGKTTLLHLLGALDTPTKGAILHEGASVAGFSDRRLAALRGRRIGFVFQSFNLVPRLTSLQNVTLPLYYSATLSGPARRERGLEILRRVGLAERSGHSPSELSGGQRQRVAIARALVNDPKVILADEPTGNLDSQTGKEILDILEELRREGRTIVLVTHDREIARRADRVVSMLDGRIRGNDVARSRPTGAS